MRPVASLCVLLALLALTTSRASPQAQAAVVTFDDLSGSELPIGNYAGFSWGVYDPLYSSWPAAFYHLDGSDYEVDSGYDKGRVSDNQVAFNGYALPVQVSSRVGCSASTI